MTAPALLLLPEATPILGLRGLTRGEYLEGRDRVALGAYLVALALFAAMPGFVAARKFRRPR